MYKVVAAEVFPFLRDLGGALGGDNSAYSVHLKDARFTIPTPALPTKVADIPMEDRDTSGVIAGSGVLLAAQARRRAASGYRRGACEGLCGGPWVRRCACEG
jgi:hypothetical protein